jgi:hypothetical protein
MADQQETNSIDDLFRQAFDQLPETSSPGGWDKPSDRVWSNVQTQLPKPAGPARYGIRVAAAIGGVAVLGLLYWFSRETSSAPALTPIPAPQPVEIRTPEVIPAPAVATPAAPRSPKAARQTAAPRTEPQVTPPAKPNFHNHAEEEAGRPIPDGHSRILPGATATPPNTTERRRRSPLHAPLKPLPQVDPVVKYKE